MLQNIIKIGKRTKVVSDTSFGVIDLSVNITKESGNISVCNDHWVKVFALKQPFKGKVVIKISEYENTDNSINIDNNYVQVQKVYDHLNSIGLNGLSNKLRDKINELDLISSIDIANALVNDESLKRFYSNFVMYDLLTDEEKLEVNK